MSIPSDSIGSAADAWKPTMLRSDSSFPSKYDDCSSRAGDNPPSMYDVDLLQSSPRSKKKSYVHERGDAELSEASMDESVASEKIPAPVPPPPPPPPPPPTSPPPAEVRPLTLREKFNALNNAFAMTGHPKTQAAIWALVRQWIDVRKVDENEEAEAKKAAEAEKAAEAKKTAEEKKKEEEDREKARLTKLERTAFFLEEARTLIDEVAGDLIRQNEERLRESQVENNTTAVQSNPVNWANNAGADADGEDNGDD